MTTDLYHFCDPARPPDRQIPPVAKLAAHLVAQPAVHGLLHHDGSNRSRSPRTSGWLHRDAIDEPWSPITYARAVAWAGDHLPRRTETADSIGHLIYRATVRAREEFAKQSPYADRVMAALRADDRMRLAEGDRTTGDLRASEWLRALDRGVIPRPELWRRYVEAGRPGALGKHRFYRVAASMLGEPRELWHAGQARVCFSA